MIYWVLTILTAVFAYAMGNLNSSIVASNLIFHADLRRLGTCIFRSNAWPKV